MVYLCCLHLNSSFQKVKRNYFWNSCPTPSICSLPNTSFASFKTWSSASNHKNPWGVDLLMYREGWMWFGTHTGCRGSSSSVVWPEVGTPGGCCGCQISGPVYFLLLQKGSLCVQAIQLSPLPAFPAQQVPGSVCIGWTVLTGHNLALFISPWTSSSVPYIVLFS